MNINTKAAVIYAEPRVNEWRDEGNERKEGRKEERTNEEKKKEGRKDDSILGTPILCRGQCLCPRFLPPTRGRLRFLPVESSPIFTTRLLSLSLSRKRGL